MTGALDPGLLIPFALIGLGVAGALLRRNLLVVLLSLQLALAGGLLVALAFNRRAPGTEASPDVTGQLLGLAILTVMVAQLVVGLAAARRWVRDHGSLDVERPRRSR